MKKSLFFVALILSGAIVFAQTKAVFKNYKINSALKNYSVKVPIKKVMKEYTSPVEMTPSVVKTTAIPEVVGTTYYDLQTNATTDHRMFYYPDGTIGLTFTIGMSPTSYPDRGTGYNYYDGTSWQPIPASRIEQIRTGWPSYSSLGSNGEVVIAHKGTGLHMSKRDTKGTGSWVESDLPTPTEIAPTWPRVCTDGNNIYVLAADQGVTYMGQEAPLVFYRSTDGGNTWDIQAQPIPGVDGASYPYGFGGDAYNWAQPKNGTIAFVVGTETTDLILMKSTDGGNTWTKKIVYQHPYPNWNESILTPDTPYVCGGDAVVALDNNGKAHVVFSRMRFLNNDTTDNSYSWFPGVDGLIYWNEDMPTLTSTDLADLDSLYNNGQLIAWCLDLDNSGVLLDNYTGNEIALYYLGLTSMPQITIDDNNDIFVIYTMIMETMQTGAANQFCRHIWGRAYSSNTGTWADQFIHLTSTEEFDLTENVFPSMAKNTSSTQVFFWVQNDFEPGLSIRGDQDQAAENYIIAFMVDKADFLSVKPIPNSMNVSQSISVYPNPAESYVNISSSPINGKVTSINIVDMTGNVVKTVNANNQLINITDLASGIYNVVVNTTKGVYTSKFVKK